MRARELIQHMEDGAQRMMTGFGVERGSKQVPKALVHRKERPGLQ